MTLLEGLITSTGKALDEVQIEQGVARAERASLQKQISGLEKACDGHRARKAGPLAQFLTSLATNTPSWLGLLALLALVIVLGARACEVDTGGIEIPFMTSTTVETP